jgi:hypothetical protein
MTTKQAKIEEQILSDRLHIRNWDSSEDDYCRRWYGSNYLGNGFIKCEFCKDNQVQFQGYFRSHVCAECEESLKNLA